MLLIRVSDHISASFTSLIITTLSIYNITFIDLTLNNSTIVYLVT